jgi:hypothetical protein
MGSSALILPTDLYMRTLTTLLKRLTSYGRQRIWRGFEERNPRTTERYFLRTRRQSSKDPDTA